MLSVVVPAFNSEADIDTLLPGLLSTSLKHAEVIVVDDGSTDATAARCRKYPVRLLSLGANGGPAKARNAGAAAAKGDVLVFVDTDVALPPGTDVLDGLERVMRERPGVDFVATVSHAQPLAKNVVAYSNSIYHAYYMDRLLRGRDNVEGALMLFTSRLGAIRASKFRQAGGFHETLHTVMAEDAEFAARCYHLGFRGYVDRHLYHYHRYPTTMKKFAKSYYLAATVKAIVGRRVDTRPDATVSGAEKFRRLFALALLALPILLWRLDPADRLMVLGAASAAFLASFERMALLVWRHVPKRLIPAWFIAYVAITPVAFAGYLRGLWLHGRGTTLLRGRRSAAFQWTDEAAS